MKSTHLQLKPRMWNVILCYSVLYFLYLLFGGVIFFFIDGFQHLTTTVSIFSNDSQHFDEMKEVLLANKYTEDEIKEAISEFYPKNTLGYFALPLYDDNVGWTLFNAFFFCFNMVATLGYSGITPYSTASQMFCIVYVLFGIPICMLCSKVLEKSYAESKNELLYLLGDRVPYSRYFSDFMFFASWGLLYYFLPPFVYLYTENWSYINGLYFSTTVAASCGLGNFFVGQNLKRNAYFAAYRILLLAWMMHAMAFFNYSTEVLSKVFSRYLLYELNVDIKEKIFEFHRVFVHPECIDIHFRLLRAEKGVRKDIDIWRADQAANKKTVYLEKHFESLVLAAEDLDEVVVSEMRKKGYSVKDLPEDFNLE